MFALAKAHVSPIFLLVTLYLMSNIFKNRSVMSFSEFTVFYI